MAAYTRACDTCNTRNGIISAVISVRMMLDARALDACIWALTVFEALCVLALVLIR